MSVEIFELQISNNPSLQYTCGETIHGVVIVSTKTSIDIRGIRINVQGTGTVEWNEKGTRYCCCCCRRNETYTSSDDFYNGSFYVLGTGRQKLTVHPGLYHYPFQHELPRGLPSSFNSENGKLKYLIKAEMELPTALGVISKQKSNNHCVERPFAVNGILDLNEEPTASQCVRVSESQEFKSLFCSNGGQIEMVLQLPKGGFLPGERVQFTVEIENHSSQGVLESTARLLKDITYKGHMGNDFRREEVIESVDGPGGISRGTTKTWEGSFNVSPDLPPIHLAHGLTSKKTIDVNYYVEIILKASGFLTTNKFLRLKTPIIIGTTSVMKDSYSKSQGYS